MRYLAQSVCLVLLIGPLLAGAGLPVGERAPDLSVRDCQGAEVRLRASGQDKDAVLLVLGPAATPSCAQAL